MGLDMYLKRMPRYGNTTPNEIYAIESYFNWKNNPDARKYTMKEWCGIPFKDVPKGKTMEFYKTYCEYRYASWDTEQKYTGSYRIVEEVGYWRKANQIHNLFVCSFSIFLTSQIFKVQAVFFKNFFTVIHHVEDFS